MFGRLLKHQLKTTYKGFNILYAGIGVCGLLLTISLKFKLNVLFILSTVFFVLFMYSSMILNFVFGFKLFYKSIYDKQAYLTHTLPINAHQIILTKLISFFLYLIGWVLSIILVVCICLIIVEPSLVTGIMETFSKSFIFLSKNPSVTFVLIPYLILSIASFIMILQLAMALGNSGTILKKHKKAAAFVWFYLITLVSTFILAYDPINLTVGLDVNNKLCVFNSIGYLENNLIPFFSIWSLIWMLITGVGSYFLTVLIIDKKLEI